MPKIISLLLCFIKLSDNANNIKLSLEFATDAPELIAYKKFHELTRVGLKRFKEIYMKYTKFEDLGIVTPNLLEILLPKIESIAYIDEAS